MVEAHAGPTVQVLGSTHREAVTRELNELAQAGLNERWRGRSSSATSRACAAWLIASSRAETQRRPATA